MKFDNTFAVTAPIETVWTTLMDFPRVTGCVPGAEILGELSPDAYQVGMKVKLGPVTMQYRGQLEVIERDAASHRAVLRGSAKEARGQGTAAATVDLTLVADGPTTRGSVSADVAISGRAAAMGQSVIGSVTEQMMGQFATNLQTMLTAEDQGAAATSAPVSATAAAAQVPAAAEGAGPAAVSVPAPAAAAPAPAAPAAASSLDGLALARGVLTAQLADPRVLSALGALVAVVAYAAGRRSARRAAIAVCTAALDRVLASASS